jgi:protease-4
MLYNGMLGAPLRLVVNLLYNLIALVRMLPRAWRRAPDWIAVELKGSLAERRPRRSFWRRSRTPSVQALAELFDLCAADPRPRGVILRIRSLEVGWATLDSVRTLVAHLRERGKRVVAHLSGGGNAEYALACACDEIYCDESAPLVLTGLCAEATFLGEALARLGVRAELHAIGEYKTAAEMFTRRDMSEPNREATSAIVDQLFESLAEAVARGRRLSPERAREALCGGPYLAEGAMAASLCDGVLYADELEARLGKGGRSARLTSAARYAARRRVQLRWRPLVRRRRAIAIVSVEGVIATGEGVGLGSRLAGDEAVARALGRVREDRRVAGVVLHVDSRGGAADASDRIWRQVVRTVRKKPVIAYLGDVAGSGGYYVVAPCTAIVAQPSTLTGSIGVIGGKLVVEDLLGKLAVGRDGLRRGEVAAMASPAHGYGAEERRRLEAELAGIYDQFVRKVAEGRRRPPEDIAHVARGRVWTGQAARERGLVDELGDLRQALALCEAAARRRPGERFDHLEVRPEPRRGGSLLSRLALLRRMSERSGLRDLAGPFSELTSLVGARAWVLMPFRLRIR